MRVRRRADRGLRRRRRAGGPAPSPGWSLDDAYPFVRLHGPSALYGVNSRSLGERFHRADRAERRLYPRATAAEICDYYQRVLPMSSCCRRARVRFFGMSDYDSAARGEHRFASRLTGDATTVRIRRRIVGRQGISSRRFRRLMSRRLTPPTPGSAADSGQHDLVQAGRPAQRVHGHRGRARPRWNARRWAPEAACCRRRSGGSGPRDAWLLDRAFQQPLDLLPRLIEGVSL